MAPLRQRGHGWCKRLEEAMGRKLETVLDGLAFPEGPRWHDGRLWFSDMHAHEVVAMTPDGRRETVFSHSGPVSGLAWLPGGDLLVVSMVDMLLLRIGADGRPRLLPAASPSKEGTVVCPAGAGATNWMSPTFSPQTGLVYVVAREQCDIFTALPQPFHPGHPYIGSVYYKPVDDKPWAALRALDPTTGEMKWEFKYVSAPWSGALSTAGGLVFAGDQEGYFIAFDARTGKDLWHFQTGAPIIAGPMTFSLDQKQYVVIASGDALMAFTLPDEAVAATGPASK